MNHFQNSISFENGFGKTGQEAAFSLKSKVAFSKTEVLKKPLIFVFFFTISVNNLYARDPIFDFAFNPGTFGWGMNIPDGTEDSHFTFSFSNLYIEHINSHIGIEISPVNIWSSYDNSRYLTSFINMRLYYNFLNLNDDDRKGSNYFLVGPFVSVNYLCKGTGCELDPNNIQFSAGLRAMGMIDYTEYWNVLFPPFGLQILNLELGYKYNNFRPDNHQFYFNISTDVLAFIYIVGAFIANGVGSDKKER